MTEEVADVNKKITHREKEKKEEEEEVGSRTERANNRRSPLSGSLSTVNTPTNAMME